MEISEIKVLSRPNYWSIRRPKLIQMKLDLEEMEQSQLNQVPWFFENALKSYFLHYTSIDAARVSPGVFSSR
jgi:cyanophycin synthetase